MPDSEICIIADGDFSVLDLKRAYGASVLRAADCRDPFLRAYSKGGGVTKMISLWEGPFEDFVYLDADTVVAGDLRDAFDFAPYGFVGALNDDPVSHNTVLKWFFRPDVVRQVYANYDVDQHLGRFFCSGVFYAKRGVLDLELYKSLAKCRSENAGAFFGSDQGILNALVQIECQQSSVNVAFERFQITIVDEDVLDLEAKFGKFEGARFAQPAVLHWCGPKPAFWRKRQFKQPSDFMRREHLRATRSIAGRPADILLGTEDILAVLIAKAARIRKRLTRKPRTALWTVTGLPPPMKTS